jgi:hypothetical protein
MSKINFSDRTIAFIVSLSFFMEAVDSTVINTAIPTMAKSLNVAPVDLKVALVSYLLSLAIFIPISGWIADKFGSKRVFIRTYEKPNAQGTFTNLRKPWMAFESSMDAYSVFAKVP